MSLWYKKMLYTLPQNKSFQNKPKPASFKRLSEKQCRLVTYSLEHTEQQLKPDWNRAVSDAEKIVGHPTSYLTLRSILSDEMSNMSINIRKLIGSSHPLLKTVSGLIFNGGNNLQTRGLIVLLVSKASGYLGSRNTHQDGLTGILTCQRSLAEITEMIHTAHLVHKAVVNVSPVLYPDKATLDDMTFGNKIAILSGDYLLANACTALASLNNSKVVELISSSISDFMEAELIGERDPQDNPLPSSDFKVQDWEYKTTLSHGSLLSKSCQGALLLAGHDIEHQEKIYEFGKYLALAWQAHMEVQPFLDIYRFPVGTHFNLASLPVVCHIQENPDFILNHVVEANFDYAKCDFGKIQRMLVNEGSAVTDAMVQCHKYANAALAFLQELEESDSRAALQNIIHCMKET